MTFLGRCHIKFVNRIVDRGFHSSRSFMCNEGALKYNLFTQETPNHNSLMFLSKERSFLSSGTVEFKSHRDAEKSPLARRIFDVEGITNVFFSSNFISVNKVEEIPWPAIKLEIFSAMADFYDSNDDLLLDQNIIINHKDINDHEDDDEVVQQIKEIIESRVRPFVQNDGGEITYQGFEDGVVLLQLSGACSGCPSSADTLKNGVQKVLMHYVPEVIAVMTVENEELDQINLERFKKVEERIEGSESPKE